MAGAVGEPDAEVEAGLHVGGASGAELADGAADAAVIGVRVGDGEVADDAVGEVDDGDAVLGAQAAADGLGGLAGDVDAVAVGHGAEASRTRVTLRGAVSRNSGAWKPTRTRCIPAFSGCGMTSVEIAKESLWSGSS